MGLFGWGEKDDTTKEERAAWKQIAKNQMKGDDKRKDNKAKGEDDGKPPRHARSTSWW